MEPRQLTATEIADFLLRHPIAASRVAVTRTAIESGLYDFNYYDYKDSYRVFPGIILPRGLVVEDSAYGNVVLYPRPQGILYTGFVSNVGDADKPDYEPPPHDRSFLDDVLDVGKQVSIGVGIAVVAGLVIYKLTENAVKEAA